MFSECRHVLRQITPCEQTTVYFWVQGFHTAIKHFRKTCVTRHFNHGQTRIRE